MRESDFDKWRQSYDGLSVAEQAAFYERLHEDHPEQKHFDLPSALKFFAAVNGNVAVMELGGYDGALAADCLEAFPNIDRWKNFDIAPATSQATDRRYIMEKLHAQLWDSNAIPQLYDVFLASHVLEHLSERDVARVLEFVRGRKYIYLDAPIKDGESTDWSHATAAHKLTWSWEALDALVKSHGYERMHLGCAAHCYERRR